MVKGPAAPGGTEPRQIVRRVRILDVEELGRDCRTLDVLSCFQMELGDAAGPLIVAMGRIFGFVWQNEALERVDMFASSHCSAPKKAPLQPMFHASAQAPRRVDPAITGLFNAPIHKGPAPDCDWGCGELFVTGQPPMRPSRPVINHSIPAKMLLDLDDRLDGIARFALAVTFIEVKVE